MKLLLFLFLYFLLMNGFITLDDRYCRISPCMRTDGYISKKKKKKKIGLVVKESEGRSFPPEFKVVFYPSEGKPDEKIRDKR